MRQSVSQRTSMQDSSCTSLSLRVGMLYSRISAEQIFFQEHGWYERALLVVISILPWATNLSAALLGGILTVHPHTYISGAIYRRIGLSWSASCRRVVASGLHFSPCILDERRYRRCVPSDCN
jgi:hypothetical protein